ncbi:MAG: carbohydrate ABC transporter permease [Actinomyces sp.]|nr:carbohydrate ABC transporter permease [Actinomyces sp.]MCI1641070.1 carbohydrate ABC transporter permease [Actinomyces sp.]MCI1661438.1 carbohydrate ABC transporter permease [Actinomyces sp.]MCI1690446.1 carbohydrate ABC transporter permease [Actinomyces sp.]MCI1787087.1 carbohydrate ABC transporter permease [Actinomyces sp.]MCI1829347.1 carbohydrate ABC transporter permease [Actinomyces sp.]
MTTAPASTRTARAAGLRRTRRLRPGRALLDVLGLVVALAWVFPVYWMLLSALTPNALIRQIPPSFLPSHATWANFRRVLLDPGFASALRMSLEVTAATVAIVLFLAFLAALAVSRYRFRGRRTFILAILFIQMLPAEGLFIAQYKMLSSVGAAVPVLGLNSVLGLTVLYSAAIIPFTVWMLRGFVAGVPVELEEAAMVDGLSRPRAFLRITFPLLAPGLVASGVYAFLQAWNEFTVALVALPDASAQTLPLWLRGFLNASVNRGVDWAQVMAASSLIAVPVIIFFMIVQNRMTSGLVAGAVKG